MSNFNKSVGQFIKQQRLSKNPKVTQTRLAKEIGVTFQQVQKYEQGSNAISLQKLLKILAYFKCAISDVPFYHWNDDKPVMIEVKEDNHVEQKEL
jgi:transcriptional regulator with XRE-family HTH domain